jgi:hypothetical protein
MLGINIDESREGKNIFGVKGGEIYYFRLIYRPLKLVKGKITSLDISLQHPSTGQYVPNKSF